jgi:heme oxygenase (biliverdin-producing, ferredoxin)
LETPCSGLPQRLKAATRELHSRAERSGVMAQLLAGTVSRPAYVALLANLQAIYAALETALQTPRLPQAENTTPLFQSLARSTVLAADLRAFGGPAPALVPATLAYVARLQSCGQAGAHRLWAHVYVRYLGDLHGGQVLSRLVQGHFGVPHSTHFYDFGDAAQVQQLRETLRGQLGSLPLSEQQRDDTVAEAVWAFVAHCELFDQLALGSVQVEQ